MSGPRRTDFLGRMIDGVVRFCLENKLVVLLILMMGSAVLLVLRPAGD